MYEKLAMLWQQLESGETAGCWLVQQKKKRVKAYIGEKMKHVASNIGLFDQNQKRKKSFESLCQNYILLCWQKHFIICIDKKDKKELQSKNFQYFPQDY